jgi:aromatic-L-amino-acid decarboxylase
VDGIKSRLREHIALAALFAHLVEEHQDFEIVAPVEFSLVCFRFKPKSLVSLDETTLESNLELLNAELEERVNASGEMFIVHTKLHETYTLRFTVGNLHTTEAHVRRAFERIAEVGAGIET